MKKLIFATLLLAVAAPSYSQIYMTRTAKVSFNATAAKSPEKIEAVNNESAAILDAGKGDVRFQMPVKSFKFERELMQQHFNENYMESDKFPKSEFKGKIANAGEVNFTKDGVYKTTVTGELTIHGVSQTVSVPGTVTVKGATVMANAKFVVKLADYKVAVPTMVADKVNKEATITVDAAMMKK